MRASGVKAAAVGSDESGEEERRMPEGVVPPPDVASLAQLARIRVSEDEVRATVFHTVYRSDVLSLCASASCAV